MNNIRKVGLKEEHGRRTPDRAAREWASHRRIASDTTDPLSAFGALIRAIEELLTPVAPRPVFREELHRNLIESSRRQFAQNAVVRHQPSTTAWQQKVSQVFMSASGRVDKRWLWSAAAVGSAVSVAGIVAIALRHRAHPASPAS